MSTLQTTVTALKGTAHSDVTTKTAALSLSAADHGAVLEALCDLFTALGWDIDSVTPTVISNVLNLMIGTLVGANTYASNSAFTVRSGINLRAALSDNIGSGLVTLRDGTSNFNAKFHGEPRTGSLSADRNLYPPDASGTIALTSDIAAASNLTYAVATDANYTVPGTHMYIRLPATTAPRNIVLPTATAGAVLEFANLSTNTGDWTFTGATAKDCSDIAIGIINATSGYRLLGEGTIWRRVN